MDPNEKNSNSKDSGRNFPNSTHLGSPNAFEETENPFSREEDNLTDERLDEREEKTADSNSGKLISD